MFLSASAKEPALQTGDQASFSVREVMESVIAPATDTLWGADNPQTDEEWQHLEDAARMVISAGAKINLGGNGPQDNEWAKSPEWRAFSEEMTSAAMASLEAISKRNADALFESGMVLYPPCEGCHLKFNPGVINQ